MSAKALIRSVPNPTPCPAQPLKALRQTSLWIMLATLARPVSGSLHVKASGIEFFFLAMNSSRASSMAGSMAGAS